MAAMALFLSVKIIKSVTVSKRPGFGVGKVYAELSRVSIGRKDIFVGKFPEIIQKHLLVVDSLKSGNNFLSPNYFICEVCGPRWREQSQMDHKTALRSYGLLWRKDKRVN